MEAENAPDDLAKAVYEKLRLYRRRKASGLVQMLRDGSLDIFDALAVAPLVLDEEKRLADAVDFERRRSAWLEAYQSIGCDDDSHLDAATHPQEHASARAHISIAKQCSARGQVPDFNPYERNPTRRRIR